MTLLDRYITKTVLSAIGMVTLMLAGLQIFILFVNQLDDLGRADFGILHAAFFILLQMPYQVYLFFPMASLLGSLIGLGILANNRELVVMRASGMSIGQITFAVLKAAFILIIFVTIIGETVVPELARFGNDQKMQSISGGQALRTARGVWLRYQNDFISIGVVQPNGMLANVHQFHFDEAHQLKFARHLETVTFQDGLWYGKKVAETLFSETRTQTREIPDLIWDIKVKPSILSVSSSEPDEMNLHELAQFLRVQKRSHQTAFSYQLVYWQRLVQPLATIVMMMLAIPFIFGPLRSSTMGSKLLAGATVGFSFHILNRFFGPLSQVLQWPPIFAALGPTFLFTLLGLYLMKRVR